MGREGHGAWAIPTAASKYGGALAGAPVVSRDQTAATPSAGPSIAVKSPPWSPDNPLFWFGVIAAASVGLMGYSTTVRVGPAKAGISVGKT
ncbi:hypothetical protein ABZ341_41710 [Streptomyces sp. NPDC006173]|uniref:hypothetical protein n=1 Tax=Streptomyces sp. NPDC006173 TaxID=3155349 RepID=UPI0033DEBA53